MEVYAIQTEIVWEDPAANIQKLVRWMDRERPKPGSFLVLPEMFATGFSMHVDRVAEPVDGPISQFLAAISDFDCYVCGGVAVREQPDSPPLNQALIYGPPRKLLARYSKQQLFTLGTESDHYQPGGHGVVARCGEFLTSVRICYDLRFPELFRADALAGAELFLVIANWPASRAAHWRALLQARAIENQAYVVGVNRTGNDPLLKYRGESAIYDPQGNPLEAADDRECALFAELDRQAVVDYRRKFPALRDTKLAHFAAIVEQQSSAAHGNASA